MLRRHYVIIIFLAFYFLVTSYKFIAKPTPFYDWDESIYAQVGREMVQHRSFVPLWQGQNWLDKPPLVPLVYGIVETVSPVKPELSTRLFTLLLSMLLFSFIYYFYFRLTKNTFVSLLTVFISAFTTIMLQRTQVLNVDIFLFLGWMGYLVFFDHFWLSFLFLGVGVLSKSLLGFYPAIGMLCLMGLQIVLGQKSYRQQKKKILGITLQMLVISLWFMIMFLRFKFPFIQAQFLDSQLKRVTASIESHFGKRTFYIDLLFEQLGFIAFTSIIGIIIVVRRFLHKKDPKQLILPLFFVPWFLFLNLTKTKINWYLYPVIPQFAFLGVFVLDLLKKRKVVAFIIMAFIVCAVLYQNFGHNQFLAAQYSTYDEQYQLALYAKNHCKELTVLVDKDSRTTHDTLQHMNLLIGTSEWWGNHPAIVYYSDKKVNFIYSVNQFKALFSSPKKNGCYVINDNDLSLINTPITPTFKIQEIYIFLM